MSVTLLVPESAQPVAVLPLARAKVTVPVPEPPVVVRVTV